MNNKNYHIAKIKEDAELFNTQDFWKEVPMLLIDNYLWMDNDFKPKVEVKISYSNNFFFAYFKVYEKEITATYTEINNPVHKDSCVELFINLFPNKTDKYFNFEVNAIGTMHVGFGAIGNRTTLEKNDIKEIQISSTIEKPLTGIHGNEYWEIFYKIPISIFKKYYGLKFTANEAKGNFYKCGDDTKHEHYGVWNNIVSEKPNFHLPNYFGELIFL